MPESTPSQTVGPFFEFALPYDGGERLVSPGDRDAIRIVGAVIDGDGRPVDDALVEIWQANRAGRYAHVQMGTLDDDPGIRPQYHMHVASKAPWHEITDTLPAFAELAPMAEGTWQ